MTAIDAHVHLYPPEIAANPAGWASAAGEGTWARMSVRTRKTGEPVQGFPTEAELLESMDRAGIARSVLVGWYWDTPEACRLQNRFYAGLIRARPDRFWALAAVPMTGPLQAALDEVGWAMAAGFSGLGELCPQAQGCPILGEVFNRVVEAAGDRPVLLHASDPAGRPYPGKVGTPHADFLALARAHPRTPFILAHWGGQLPLLEPGVLPANLYFDTAASPLLYEPGIWGRFLERVPADRVLFGSDLPLVLYPGAGLGSAGLLLAEARAQVADPLALAQITRGTAQRMFGAGTR